MYKIIFSSKALKNLDDIKEFISSDNEIISEKVINAILGIISNLVIFPKLGNEIGSQRKIVEPAFRYQIRYKVIEDTIYIITIYKFKNEL